MWQFEEDGSLSYTFLRSPYSKSLRWTFDIPMSVTGIVIREVEGQRSERQRKELGGKRIEAGN